ncbi:hypothetical protein [Methylocaldum sp.]|uniref:hypothetical protein n=1 Tax=Methylocaldum sp. TaxID=1969727 RepID=UPI002D73CB0D|nr:hypothetical protein [Methylocaldum sp.]HYE38138.1 hypothetical protein [Methylocaldum sp.]
MPTKTSRPAQRISDDGLKAWLTQVRQSLLNASISLPPYNSHAFRIDRLDEAIAKLQWLKSRLQAEQTLDQMKG